MHYAAYLKDELDKQPFDYTFARPDAKPEPFYMRTNALLPGLELGLEQLKNKSQAIIICQPEWAYGKYGIPPRIPGNSTVIFWVKGTVWFLLY